MKKLTIFGIMLITLGFVFIYRETLIKFWAEHFVHVEKVVSLSPNQKNEYFLDYDFEFIQNTANFEPQKKQDILNIYYTILNSGLNEFSFYCPENYSTCLSDVKDISNDQTLLSNINNFVHVYNGFKNIETEYDSLGKIDIRIVHTYTEDKINTINQKVEEIMNQIIQEEDDTTTKIKAIHDYIIQNSKYDSARSDQQITKYDSDTAYGNLIQGYGICGGYTDSMKLFLDKLGIPNYKIASENHVWNLVYVDNQWLHLDLTWDDPIVTSGKDVLEYNFFLITTEELKSLKTNQHNFDGNVYQEAITRTN